MRNLRMGFTIVEVLVAAVILMLIALGVLPLMITNIKLNESAQKRQGAIKILESISKKVRAVGAQYLTEGNLKNMDFWPPSQFHPGGGYPSVSIVGTNCPAGYDYVMFMGREFRVGQVSGSEPVKRYFYTLKLCVDDDYLKPYVKKVLLYIYWFDWGKLRHMKSEIFVGQIS